MHWRASSLKRAGRTCLITCSITRLVLLDTLGVILAGFERPEVRHLVARLTASGGTGATILAPGWPSSDPRTAALLNGIAGRSIELCEGLRLVSGQAAMQVLPGALAVAEQANASGKELLSAFILGYEVAARFCAAFTPRPLAHQNGQACLLGAAAAGRGCAAWERLKPASPCAMRRRCCSRRAIPMSWQAPRRSTWREA